MRIYSKTSDIGRIPVSIVWIQILERLTSRFVLESGKTRFTDQEVSMRNFFKFFVAVMAALLISGTALPSHAQTRVYSNVIPIDAGGAYLGIQMDDVTADNVSKYKLKDERGVIVRSVMKGSPAEKANLKEDDVILEFGGFPVWSSQQFSRLVKETPVDRKVDLVVSRDGKRMNLSAQLKEREGRRAENRMLELLPEDFGRDANRFLYRFAPPNGPDRDVAIIAGRRPRLGLTLQPVTEQLGEYLGVPDKKGALVASVETGSPCEGKVKSGDVIIGADDKSIEDPDDLAQYVRSREEKSIELKIIRDKKEIVRTINLPEQEKERGKGYKL